MTNQKSQHNCAKVQTDAKLRLGISREYVLREQLACDATFQRHGIPTGILWIRDSNESKHVK